MLVLEMSQQRAVETRLGEISNDFENFSGEPPKLESIL